MKGQTQAITAVMITGIVVGAAASAYVWGAPIIEKRDSVAELQNVESKALNIEESITEVSQSGTGNSQQVDLSLENGEIKVNPDKNFLEFTYFTKNAPYPTDSWRFLKGQSRQGLSFGKGNYGISGENTPGIVAVQRDSASGQAVKYRIEFRNMRTSTPSGPELRMIDLQSEGSETAIGEVEISITNQGKQTDSGSDAFDVEGRTLSRTRSIVQIDLR